MGGEPVGKGVITTRAQQVAAAAEAALALLAILLFAFFRLDRTGGPPAFPLASLLPAAGLLLCIAGIWLLQARFGIGRLTLPVLMLALVAFDLSRLAGLWPCDVGCQGGAHYQTVLGISVVWPALAAHLAMAVLTLRDLRHGGWCSWTRHTLGLLVGVTWFFSGISAQLGLDCTYCSAIHLTTFFAWMALITVWPSNARWWHVLAWPLVGWLLANAVFHHGPVADVAAPTVTTPTVMPPGAADAALLQRIDAARSRGRADAPTTLELALDLHCASCAKLHGPLMTALAPALADGRLKVVVRLLVRSSHPVGRDAARLVLAAAAAGEHETALTTLLDSNPRSQPDGLRARLAEVIAIAPVDAVLRDHLAALDQVISEDAARLAKLKIGIRTPSAVLLRGERELGRWSGDFAPALVVDALAR